MDNDLVRQLIEENKALQKEVSRLQRNISYHEATIQRSIQVSRALEKTYKILENESKNRDKYFSLMMQSTSEVVLLFDQYGRLAYVSDSFLKKVNVQVLGMIAGRTYKEIFVTHFNLEEDHPLIRAIESSLITLTPVSLQETLKSEDTFDYAINVTPIVNEEGQLHALSIFMHDVTRLNALIVEAKETSMAKSYFLANMSHEIRTPMNAIIGMITIAESTDEIDKIRYCLKKIDDSSVHLLGVINDILDISKIESGKFEVSFTNFNFERMLERLLAVVRYKLEEKNIEFNIYVDRNMPRRIISDEQRIAQVIANLLSNAVKFTPVNGKVTIIINKIDTIGNVNNIQIIVKDTGIGLSEEHKEKLFKPFSQAENNTSRKYGGTGLGLAISKSIVEKLGGNIWVESVFGQGSSFIFNILAETGPEETDEVILDKQLADLRILAIDDQDETLRFFRGIGKKLKVKIDLAEDGYKALELIKQNHYDIAFVDWKMPGLNGIEVARKIKEIEEDSTILIMISALEWNEIEKEAREAGIKKFISKPLLMPIIEDALLDCIGANDDSQKEDELINIFADKHILLAEDVEINREIVYSLLEKTGLNIDSAENGEIAVKTFKENPEKYDLIFMDIQMPIMDGYVATKNIRKLDIGKSKTIPIVAMTANVFKTDIEQALASGMNGHIGKPIDIDEVTETLKKYLLEKGN